MSCSKKILKIIAMLTLGLVLLILVLFWPVWPSKAKLCQDVKDYLPKAKCMQLNNAVEIVMQAFPEGEVTSSDVKGALGEYLHNEHLTTYGHMEEYYLSVRPIGNLLIGQDSYRFRYKHDGVLVAFSYDD